MFCEMVEKTWAIHLEGLFIVAKQKCDAKVVT